jgi:hypothetical protein
MIKVIQPDGRKQDPYYLLYFQYMIGDADGDTEGEAYVSLDNPFVERFVTLLNRLKPPKHYWGFGLKQDKIEEIYKEGQMTEDEYKFLTRILFDDREDNDYFKTEQENDWADEFNEGVKGEVEYSFLTFQGVYLIYVDETGRHLKTEIVPDETK